MYYIRNHFMSLYTCIHSFTHLFFHSLIPLGSNPLREAHVPTALLLSWKLHFTTLLLRLVHLPVVSSRPRAP